MFYLEDKRYYNTPLVNFSSINPDFNNDWTDWEKGNLFLHYQDIVLVAFNIVDYYSDEVAIHFVSQDIPLPNKISVEELSSAFPEKELVFEGNINLTDRKFNYGEEFGFDIIETLSNILHIKIWVKANQYFPEYLVEIESL